MGIVAVGVDLAKNVFALHGVDETGKVILRKPNVKRDQLLALFAGLPPCLVGMKDLTQAQCNSIAKELNTRPRKRFGYLTPEVLYARQ